MACPRFVPNGEAWQAGPVVKTPAGLVVFVPHVTKSLDGYAVGISGPEYLSGVLPEEPSLCRATREALATAWLAGTSRGRRRRVGR